MMLEGIIKLYERKAYIKGFMDGANNTDTKYIFRLAKELNEVEDKIHSYFDTNSNTKQEKSKNPTK